MSLTQYLRDIIFPRICLSCKTYLGRKTDDSPDLCRRCAGKLDFMSGFLCPVCFRRLPGGENVCHDDARFVLAAPLRYSNPVVRELVRLLKYGGLRAAADPLVSVLAEYLRASILNLKFEISNWVIVPVPLHKKRERKRTFNQAGVMAELLKSKMGDADSKRWSEIPIIGNAVIRKRDTPSQTKQKEIRDRIRNISGSFEVIRPEFIVGKNIFLVDDVFTSGATMREIVRVLRLAGAQKIIAVTVAHA